MSSFFSFLAKRKFPNTDTRQSLLSGPLTPLKAVIYILFLSVLILCYLIVIRLNDKLLVTIPADGGSLTEGVIGSPRFINPILAATETDTALTYLVYSGLMKEKDGVMIPELAASYEVSPDGMVYRFKLRKKVSFNDGTPLTSSDVAFTVEKLQDPDLNGRDALYWQTISTETPDQSTVVFNLLTPDAAFLKKLNFGILPVSYWQGVVDEAFIDPSLNLSPIGTGPFKFKSLSVDESGAPTQMTFERNKYYVLGKPYIKELVINIYANQEQLFEAIKNGSVDISFSLNPITLTDKKLSSNITTTPVAAGATIELFRRSNETTFQNPAFLTAINKFIDKALIIATVENGYGIPAAASPVSFEETITTLNRLGYTYKDGVLTKETIPIRFSIATENRLDLIATSNALAAQLKNLGITISVEVYERGSFLTGLDSQIFPLVLIESDYPRPSVYVSGIPLYTKTILITTRRPIGGTEYETLPTLSKRYDNVSTWFVRTDRVWKFFSKQ